MKIRVHPSELTGSLSAPPSKSVAHRLLIASTLSDGTSLLHGIEAGEDVQATMDCLKLLGAEITHAGEDVLQVRNHGLGLPEDVIFPLRESGSTFRFIVPVALMIGGKARFQGSQRLMERGIRVYEDLFREKGILVRQEMIAMRASDPESGGEARTSLYVDGQLNPGLFRLPGGISSQFISGLLFALPCLSGDSVIEIIPPVESNPYIGLTIGTLKRFGVEALRESETVIRVPGGQHFRPVDLALEGDWSNGAVLLAFRSLGHRISVEGLDPESLQGDRAFLDFSQRLEKESFPQIDLRDTPDLGPVLFVLAAAKNGAVFTGIERLRLKESDRLQAMAEELRKFGAEIETHEHSAVILPTPLHIPSETLKSHNDHRVVMALTLLLSLYGGEIEGAEAVRKSYPDFFTDLRALGLLIEADQPIFGS